MVLKMRQVTIYQRGKTTRCHRCSRVLEQGEKVWKTANKRYFCEDCAKIVEMDL